MVASSLGESRPGTTIGIRTFTVAFSPLMVTFAPSRRPGESALRPASTALPPLPSVRLAVRAAFDAWLKAQVTSISCQMNSAASSSQISTPANSTLA